MDYGLNLMKGAPLRILTAGAAAGALLAYAAGCGDGREDLNTPTANPNPTASPTQYSPTPSPYLSCLGEYSFVEFLANIVDAQEGSPRAEISVVRLLKGSQTIRTAPAAQPNVNSYQLNLEDENGNVLASYGIPEQKPVTDASSPLQYEVPSHFRIPIDGANYITISYLEKSMDLTLVDLVDDPNTPNVIENNKVSTHLGNEFNLESKCEPGPAVWSDLKNWRRRALRQYDN